jgi:hypothetical protein
LGSVAGKPKFRARSAWSGAATTRLGFLLSENGRNLVKAQFEPKQIIAVHIPPNEAEEVSKQLKKDNPEIIAFTKILEEKRF